MTASIIFIPLLLGVLIKYNLKIERAGLYMLVCLQLIFLLQILPSLVFIEALEDNAKGTIKILAAILTGTLICVSFLIQIYFLTETMRVRIWIQSRDHLELKTRLKAFKRFKITIVVLLVMLFMVSGMVYGYLKKNSESNLYNIFRILSSVILIVMFTLLGYHQFKQYHFFI